MSKKRAAFISHSARTRDSPVNLLVISLEQCLISLWGSLSIKGVSWFRKTFEKFMPG